MNVIRRRWQAAGIVIVLIAAGWLISTARTHQAARTAANTSLVRIATTNPSPSPSDWFTAPRPGRDVSWHVFAGMDLPVSQTSGPYCLTETRASCFAHTPDGAAIAAAQLLVRTFPFTGSDAFEPTIAEQVTGPGAPALERLTAQAYTQAARTAGVRNGEPILSTDGWIAGYRPTAATQNSTTIEVLVANSGLSLGFAVYPVQLIWQDGDWRLIAPTFGDWRTVARSVLNPYPSSFRNYDNLGLGPGGAP